LHRRILGTFKEVIIIEKNCRLFRGFESDCRVFDLAKVLLSERKEHPVKIV